MVFSYSKNTKIGIKTANINIRQQFINNVNSDGSKIIESDITHYHIARIRVTMSNIRTGSVCTFR